ncbi:hypothetical protein SteCoe_22837 [Stentor coeruleus]|uniref:Uncharacterized protein n=1 Tax=Stentor coeruleus TaxID=5963 RepID=A0A1R2BLE8_9CILI|nr:hypothetical protein SteCoe_22837 [Stentor coeruleus]
MRVFIIALITQVLSCTLTRTIDLKYYISSLINEPSTSDTSFDSLTCDGKPIVYGVLTTESVSTSSPKLILIWDVGHTTSIYSCTMSKSFFVPGRLTDAMFDIFVDDFVLVKINDVQVSEISTTAQSVMQNNINVLSYIKVGLNSLTIIASNSGGMAYFGYRITIWAQLI